VGLQDNHKETPQVHTIPSSLWERGSGVCRIHHSKFVHCTDHTYVRGGVSCAKTYGATRTRVLSLKFRVQMVIGIQHLQTTISSPMDQELPKLHFQKVQNYTTSHKISMG
jgi:hypothetical protein